MSHCGFASSGVILLPRILVSLTGLWAEVLGRLFVHPILPDITSESRFALTLRPVPRCGIYLQAFPPAAAQCCPSLAFSSVIGWCSCVLLLLLGFH